MLRGLVQQAIQQTFDWAVGPETLSDKAPSRATAPKLEPGKRQITLQGQAVIYQFERSKRRTIGFIVGEHGLLVRAPRWVTIGEVESSIQEKASWILKKIHETNDRRAHSGRVLRLAGIIFEFGQFLFRQVDCGRHGLSSKFASGILSDCIRGTDHWRSSEKIDLE